MEPPHTFLYLDRYFPQKKQTACHLFFFFFFPEQHTTHHPQKQAGQERFRTLSTSFYRGAHGVLVVYDVTSRTSFASVDRWFDEAELNAGEDVALYLVGTKTDKAAGAAGSSSANRAVSTLEGQQAAEARGARFCEVSAKTGEGVRTPFVEIIDEIVAKGGGQGDGQGRYGGAKPGAAAGLVNLGGGGDSNGGGSLCAC